MAQAHARLGARVTLIGEQVMPRDEPEAVDVVCQVFEREGIEVIRARAEAAAQDGTKIMLRLDNGREVQGDMLLVAVGRTPNIEALALDKAGVHYSAQGIQVDQHLRTNVQHIYAVGDVTDGPKFTHYAGWQGSVAAINSLVPVYNTKGLNPALPWVTYTDPEVAHVGMTEAQAREQYGDGVKVSILPMNEGDRAVAENDTAGFVKLVYRGSGQLLGATIVAARAGEMIVEYTYVIAGKLSLGDVSNVMHAYPTYSDIAKKAVSQLRIAELFDGVSGKALDLVAKTLIR
jgi:pyruvate/2-oxoglutarate dehydrogenase complex dihydrolipoamide dehydrogenase (E3) component